MKIIRNGVEYELTGTEVYDAHEEYEHNCLIEDIKAKAKEMEIDLTDKDIGDIAYLAERNLGKNDGYYEYYWMSIEYALEQI